MEGCAYEHEAVEELTRVIADGGSVAKCMDLEPGEDGVSGDLRNGDTCRVVYRPRESGTRMPDGSRRPFGPPVVATLTAIGFRRAVGGQQPLSVIRYHDSFVGGSHTYISETTWRKWLANQPEPAP